MTTNSTLNLLLSTSTMRGNGMGRAGMRRRKQKKVPIPLVQLITTSEYVINLKTTKNQRPKSLRLFNVYSKPIFS